MRNFRSIGILGALGLIGGLVGCSQGFQSAPANSTTLNSEAGNPAAPGGGSAVSPTPAPTPTSTPTASLGICSKLDFVGIDWPKALIEGERKAMALSLNITGSFEGSAGWANLGNNFDGQGMSLGLSQQNFGQGTLQPLLQSMVQKQPTMMSALFSNANLKSMTTMLKPFAAASFSTASTNNPFADFSSDESLYSNATALNSLDEGFETKTISAMDAKSTASVTWAKANVYQAGGSVFKTDWKNSFLSLAVTAPYRSLQVSAAMSMFAKAAGYFDSLKFKELRSLLMMYDIVVQNGGLTSTHVSQYRSWVAANPNATETAKLTKLVEIRVVSVLAKYKGDVRARKMTIVNGTGTVHGAKRDLQKEYCFKSSELVP